MAGSTRAKKPQKKLKGNAGKKNTVLSEAGGLEFAAVCEFIYSGGAEVTSLT